MYSTLHAVRGVSTLGVQLVYPRDARRAAGQHSRWRARKLQGESDVIGSALNHKNGEGVTNALFLGRQRQEEWAHCQNANPGCWPTVSLIHHIHAMQCTAPRCSLPILLQSNALSLPSVMRTQILHDLLVRRQYRASSDHFCPQPSGRLSFSVDRWVGADTPPKYTRHFSC